MTDQELLKLAASAAGMQWIDDCRIGLTVQRAEGSEIYNFHWNALKNNKNSIQLVVALDIDLTKPPFCNIAWDDPDLRAKQRRAIVEVAAAQHRHSDTITTDHS